MLGSSLAALPAPVRSQFYISASSFSALAFSRVFVKLAETAPGELGLSRDVLEPPALQQQGSAESRLLLCCFSWPPPPSSHWLQFVFPLYYLWLACNGRCSIFVLHLIIFWRPVDIISHCIGGGLAEMMGDISCLSQRDGLCRACAFFSHSVMLCLGMCRGS